MLFIELEVAAVGEHPAQKHESHVPGKCEIVLSDDLEDYLCACDLGAVYVAVISFPFAGGLMVVYDDGLPDGKIDLLLQVVRRRRVDGDDKIIIILIEAIPDVQSHLLGDQSGQTVGAVECADVRRREALRQHVGGTDGIHVRIPVDEDDLLLVLQSVCDILEHHVITDVSDHFLAIAKIASSEINDVITPMVRSRLLTPGMVSLVANFME